MFRWIAILLMALHYSSLHANEIGMIINGRSIHTEEEAEEEKVTYNEENWGTGLQYSFDTQPNGWKPFISASGFVDSNNNSSYYAGGGYLHRVNTLSMGDTITTSLGAVGFLMSREFPDGTRLLPGVLPMLSLDVQYLSFNITYVPENSSTQIPIYFIQIVLPIDEI